MKKLRNLKSISIWVILIFITLSSCDSHDSNADGSKLDEITEILKSVSIHPSKAEIETNNQSSGSNASITRKYKSDVPFDEVKEFYLKQLANQGWQLIEEQELKDKGRYKGERVLHFTRGEFLLSVQFAGKRKEVLGWDYALRIAHPSDWKEKV
ncbi:MAG: hypothetical protein M3388_16980 [Acidobacteriota bacterium]|nr:hypothetical protein [Acidobacteriota bacterium]